MTQLEDKIVNYKHVINKYKNKPQEFYVCILDVKDFRFVNYIYGYNYGNILLDKIIAELKTNIPIQCDISRFTGDRILIIIPICVADCNKKVIEKIFNLLKVKLKINDKLLLIDFKIGISICPNDSQEIEECIKYAEFALAYTKRKSKNKYQFFKKFMYEEFIRKLKMYSFLDCALDSNEFVIYYQPQIDISKMKIFGVEALIRWNSPKYGIVSPFEFIEKLEQTEKINDVGRFVIYEACKEIKKLNDLENNNLCISINVSPRQLQDKSFPKFISYAIEKAKISSKDVCLEITERNLIEYKNEIINNLIELNNMGIKLYIDDFGVKYSSLNYLRQFVFDGIKIDKSFVDEIHTSEKQFTITKNIVELSQKLNIDVIAEGIEGKEQLKCLKKMNCTKIQGYLFSKPICSSELTDFVKKFNDNKSCSNILN